MGFSKEGPGGRYLKTYGEVWEDTLSWEEFRARKCCLGKSSSSREPSDGFKGASAPTPSLSAASASAECSSVLEAGSQESAPPPSVRLARVTDQEIANTFTPFCGAFVQGAVRMCLSKRALWPLTLGVILWEFSNNGTVSWNIGFFTCRDSEKIRPAVWMPVGPTRRLARCEPTKFLSSE